jgi:iron(III) transport system permease protein
MGVGDSEITIPKHSRQRPTAAGFALRAAIWLLLAVFVLYPIARLFLALFLPDGQSGGAFDAIARLADAFADRYTRRATLNSLLLASSVGLCGTALGFLFAFAVTRLGIPRIAKAFFSSVTTLAFVSPPFTGSVALTIVLGPGGLLPTFFGLPDVSIYGFPGTLLAETLTYFPLAFLTLATVLAAIDPTLEDAARGLGAPEGRVFRTVTLPLCIPGLANAFLLLFAESLADFATPLVMAGKTFPVLPTQIYLQITGMYDLRGGAILASVLLAPALAVFVAQRRWVGVRSYVTVTGKGIGAPRHTRSGILARGAILGTITVVTFFVVLLYTTIVASSFVKVLGIDNSFTLDNYRFVFTSGLNSIADTLLIAVSAAIPGTALAVCIALLARRGGWCGAALEFVSLANAVFPGTVLGIAWLIAFNSGPIVLTGTMGILVALCVFRYDATGIRTTLAALRQIDPALEEASLSLGASRLTTLRRVTLPLVLPAVKAGMRSLFTVSMTAISAVIFLVSVNWSLLTVRILQCMTELMFAEAAAFSVVLVGIVFAASACIDLLFRFLCPER